MRPNDAHVMKLYRKMRNTKQNPHKMKRAFLHAKPQSWIIAGVFQVLMCYHAHYSNCNDSVQSTYVPIHFGVLAGGCVCVRVYEIVRELARCGNQKPACHPNYSR